MYRFVDFSFLFFFFQKASFFRQNPHFPHYKGCCYANCLFNNYHSNRIHNGFKRKHLCEKSVVCINLMIFKLLSSKVSFIIVKECTKMDSLLVAGVL